MWLCCFNPGSHGWSDSIISLSEWRTYVSIHAPTGGATRGLRSSWALSRFQSTLPRGERLSALTRSTSRGLFQSTLPRGERPGSSLSTSMARVFQSTLPRGERLDRRQIGGDFGVSIHAPTGGATWLIGLWRERRLFQSTLPRGERLPLTYTAIHIWDVSIHAPTGGATHL